MQTVLGAGGDIGRLLAHELTSYTNQIRLVGRNPKKINEQDELMAGSLLDATFVKQAIEGSEIAYLVVGLPYNHKIWQAQWPIIVKNVIEACLHHQCKLVFFDNVYLYDKHAIPHMREDSPVNPPSKKGKVRAQLVQMINDAIRKDGLNALIARSADFYGPGAANGILNILVLDKFKKGGTANWQSDISKKHSFTFTPDAAKATAILGNTASAYGQAWHLPTSHEQLTGRQFIELAAKLSNKKPKYSVLNKVLLTIAGLFSKTIAELVEMQYQNTQDYFFDSEKFESAFSLRPTSYEQGIRQCFDSQG